MVQWRDSQRRGFDVRGVTDARAVHIHTAMTSECIHAHLLTTAVMGRSRTLVNVYRKHIRTLIWCVFENQMLFRLIPFKAVTHQNNVKEVTDFPTPIQHAQSM